MHILLVEDELKIANLIERCLREECYTVDVADNGEKALYLIDSNPYDLLILDHILPEKEGLSICKEIRDKKKEIRLTIKEYALLEYLIQNVNKSITRTMISEHVWNENFDSFTNITDIQESKFFGNGFTISFF